MTARILAQCTAPKERVGGSEVNSQRARDLGRGAVRKAIAAAYDPATQVFAEIRDTVGGANGLEMAKAFYAAIMSGRIDEARDILRRANAEKQRSVGMWDGGRYYQANRKNKGVRPLIIGDSRAFTRYVEEQATMVGESKAGWINAGKQARDRSSGGAPLFTLHNLAKLASNDFDPAAFARAARIIRQSIVAALRAELRAIRQRKRP